MGVALIDWIPAAFTGLVSTLVRAAYAKQFWHRKLLSSVLQATLGEMADVA
jgi:hypothetical protein